MVLGMIGSPFDEWCRQRLSVVERPGPVSTASPTRDAKVAQTPAAIHVVSELPHGRTSCIGRPWAMRQAILGKGN
jgi:hypothetical protein